MKLANISVILAVVLSSLFIVSLHSPITICTASTPTPTTATTPILTPTPTPTPHIECTPGETKTECWGDNWWAEYSCVSDSNGNTYWLHGDMDCKQIGCICSCLANNSCACVPTPTPTPTPCPPTKTPKSSPPPTTPPPTEPPPTPCPPTKTPKSSPPPTTPPPTEPPPTPAPLTYTPTPTPTLTEPSLTPYPIEVINLMPCDVAIFYPDKSFELVLRDYGAPYDWSIWGGGPDSWASMSKWNGHLESGETDIITVTIDWDQLPSSQVTETTYWFGITWPGLTGDAICTITAIPYPITTENPTTTPTPIPAEPSPTPCPPTKTPKSSPPPTTPPPTESLLTPAPLTHTPTPTPTEPSTIATSSIYTVESPIVDEFIDSYPTLTIRPRILWFFAWWLPQPFLPMFP